MTSPLSSPISPSNTFTSILIVPNDSSEPLSPLDNKASESQPQPPASPAKPFRDRFNIIDAEIKKLESRLPTMQTYERNLQTGIPNPDLTEIRRELRAQIQKCKTAYEKFITRIEPYDKAREADLVEQIKTKYEVVSQLESINSYLDFTPEEVRINQSNHRKEIRLCACAAIVVFGAFVAALYAVTSR